MLIEDEFIAFVVRWLVSYYCIISHSRGSRIKFGWLHEFLIFSSKLTINIQIF
jgi:hypothetical protein